MNWDERSVEFVFNLSTNTRKSLVIALVVQQVKINDLNSLIVSPAKCYV